MLGSFSAKQCVPCCSVPHSLCADPPPVASSLPSGLKAESKIIDPYRNSQHVSASDWYPEASTSLVATIQVGVADGMVESREEREPSGLKPPTLTSKGAALPDCTERSSRSGPRSQILTVPFSSPVARRVPSRLKATPCIARGMPPQREQLFAGGGIPALLPSGRG